MIRPFARLAQQVVQLARDGHQILVFTEADAFLPPPLQRMGIESKLVGDCAVTDRESRDVAVMVSPDY